MLVFFRIVWRIKTKPPQLPEKLQAQKLTIDRGHILIYILMVVMPLSGWVLVSTNPQGIPTILFGLVDWLHLSLPKSFFDPAHSIHFYGAIVISVVVIGHVSMTVKHHLSGIQILNRMQLSSRVFLSVLISSVFLVWLSTFVFQVNSAAPVNAEKTISEKVISDEKVDSDQTRSNGKIQTSESSNETTIIDSASSDNQILFSGEHAGRAFTGSFTDWQLDTDLDVQNQSMSRFNLSVKTAQTDTGSKLYDKTLKEEDWFNVESFSQAYFKASKAEFISEKQIKMKGELTIKEVTKPLVLIFNLKNNVLHTQFTLKRSEFNIGQDADPDAEWVSEEIEVHAQINLSTQIDEK